MLTFKFWTILFIVTFSASKLTAQTGPQELQIPDSILLKDLFPCGAGLQNGGNQSGSSGNFVSLGSFPSSAIFSCSSAPHFRLYVEDLIPTNPAVGFGDPFDGPTRLNTFCAVLQYLENTFDFSNVPTSNPIRINVNKSLAPVVNPAVNIGWFAAAGPLFSGTPSLPANGYLRDYVITGTDPNAGGYHATMSVNFDQVVSTQGSITFINPINWYNGLGTVGNCQMDLFSTLLHEMGHTLGFISLVQYNINTPFLSGGLYSSLDDAVYVGNIGSLTKLMSGGILNTNVNAARNYWINGLATPNNFPLYSGTHNFQIPSKPTSYIAHFDDQNLSFPYRERVSPGYRQSYVMAPFGVNGVMRRQLTETETRFFNQILGYPFAASYQSAHAVTLANTPPYSSRMSGYSNGSPTASYPISSASGFPECVPQDFPSIINNGTNTITFLLAQDATIVDPDADPVYIEPGSIINLRGCGNSQGSNNGNNHDQLGPITNSSGDIVGLTFTPRAGFYGRAQFAVTLTDKKERGSFVIYTIDVLRNNPVNLPFGAELVLNGGFEEGMEVRRKGTSAAPSEEAISYSSVDENTLQEGQFITGCHLSDSHPYGWWCNGWTPYGGGIIIQDADIPCASANPGIRTYGSGSFANSFPGIGFTPPTPVLPPNPMSNAANNGGRRYQRLNPFASGLYLLADSIKNCHYYTLTFDVYAPNSFPANGNMTSVPLVLGLTSQNLIGCNSTNYNNVFNTTLNFQVPGWEQLTPGMLTIPTQTWTPFTVSFMYCGNPSDVLFIHPAGGIGNYTQLLFVDNISLKEAVPPNTLAVSQTPISPCNAVQLNVVGNLPPGCGVGGPLTYSWTPTTGLNNPNIPNPIATNPQNWTNGLINPINYTCTVSNGCVTHVLPIEVDWWLELLGRVRSQKNACDPNNTLYVTLPQSLPGLTYVWSGPGIVGSNTGPSVNVNQSGVYSVSITAPSGCTQSLVI